MSLIRFGVSMDQSLVELLDRFIEEEKLPNRSEALRMMVRKELTRGEELEPSTDQQGSIAPKSQSPKASELRSKNSLLPIPGTISTQNQPQDQGAQAIVSLVYPAGQKLKQVSISMYPSLSIQSNLKLHLTPEVILSILVVKGSANEIHSWAREFQQQKSVMLDVSLFSLETITGAFAPKEAQIGFPTDDLSQDSGTSGL